MVLHESKDEKGKKTGEECVRDGIDEDVHDVLCLSFGKERQGKEYGRFEEDEACRYEGEGVAGLDVEPAPQKHAGKEDADLGKDDAAVRTIGKKFLDIAEEDGGDEAFQGAEDKSGVDDEGNAGVGFGKFHGEEGEEGRFKKDEQQA
jgi:hypothetical protein